MDRRQAHKFCICCGKEINIDRNERNCTSCGFKDFVNPIPAVGGVIVIEDRILLVKRARKPEKGKWDLPGGFVEINENFEDAIKREIKEELGVKVTSIKYFNSVLDTYLFSEVRDYIVVINFLVSVDSTDFLPSDDIDEAVLFDLHNLPMNSIAFTSVAETLRQYEKTIVVE